MEAREFEREGGGREWCGAKRARVQRDGASLQRDGASLQRTIGPHLLWCGTLPSYGRAGCGPGCNVTVDIDELPPAGDGGPGEPGRKARRFSFFEPDAADAADAADADSRGGGGGGEPRRRRRLAYGRALLRLREDAGFRERCSLSLFHYLSLSLSHTHTHSL